MKLLLKILGYLLASLVLLVVIAIGAVSVAASKELNRKFDLPFLAPVTIPSDSSSIERGRRLATAVANCVECHGEDFGGKLFMDAGPLGVVSGPNLTRGAGGLGATFSDADWIRAIRYGIRRDSTSLIVMPSETFAFLSDGDMAALIAYIKQLAPVDRSVKPTELRLLGKALMVTGALPILVAKKTPRPARAEVQPAVSVEYGKYLADISGCRGCHGLQLSGGIVAGPPGTPPTANLTPEGRIAKWSEADFFTVLREGKRPDGTAINDFMPWRVLGRMSDDELRAILLYLRSLPPVPTGNR